MNTLSSYKIGGVSIAGSQWTSGSNNIFYNSGSVGIGTTTPTTKLDVAGDINIATGSFLRIGGVATSQWLTDGNNIYNNSGNVGIGTTNTFGYKLAVNGTIGAKEVKVEITSPWPDFVFNTNHKLRTLGEVEQFIKANNHLPEIPTATEVKENGIGLGEMNAKLLQKVEELTLYLIEQNKTMDQQQEQMSELRKVNEKQNQIINELGRKLEIIANKK